ncbi:MAG: Hsp20/alpha crystallin family protein [Fimbriimonadales bacterium]
MSRTNMGFDPIAEMQQWIQLMDQAYGKATETIQDAQVVRQRSFIPIDLFESDNHLFVRAAIPGVRQEDVSVAVENSVLTISAETRPWTPNGESEVRWFRSETPCGKFMRSIRLPDRLQFDAITAEIEDGVVLVKIPGLEALKPKTIHVPVGKVEAKPTSKSLPDGAKQLTPST